MDSLSLDREEIEKVYGKISPFELKDRLIELAEESEKKGIHSLLDAGRGNPNWIAASPREAFFTFGHFAVEESRMTWSNRALAGMPNKDGISKRFMKYIKDHKDAPGIDLLYEMINYGITVKRFDADQWIYELADGIIGDNYPQPDRMLRHVEDIVQDYLIQEFCYNGPLERKFSLFAVEGATAGMCYVFDSLIANNLLSKGDKIALMTPIFTPYLEIPHLPRYNFDVVEIYAGEKMDNGVCTWQYPDEEIKKISDPNIKALFLVNPSNPPSVAIKRETIKALIDITENINPDLMIVSDDVYGTFVDDFRSLMSDLPYNTLGVYSFSKYFGVTGWRLGTIALYENNVFDKLISEQDKDKKERARRRYGGLSMNPDNLLFIDRIVADSRQVALNHTAGLSTPQQIQMMFFSLFAILDKENEYKNMTKEICRRRKKLLYQGLSLDFRDDPLDAAYYAQFDLLEWASSQYGDSLVQYLQQKYKPIDILFKLAEQSSIVLLGGSGFQCPEWSVRISLANLSDESYSRIGQVLSDILKDYTTEWKKSCQHNAAFE